MTSASALPAFAAPRPGFNITTMSNNFRRFNARIGVVFVFQARVVRLLTWQQPTHTLSMLAVYSFICLDPYLLAVVPLVVVLLGAFVPAFVERHAASAGSQGGSGGAAGSDKGSGKKNGKESAADGKAASSPNEDDDGNGGSGAGGGAGNGGGSYFTTRGPPIAPAVTIKPAREFSRDFFRNMGDLQNSMEDFSSLHDRIVALVVPAANFADEALSSLLFLLLSAAALVMALAAHLVPWRAVFLVAGWAAVGSCHPYFVTRGWWPALKSGYIDPMKRQVRAGLEEWTRRDIVLDSAPLTREVEVFELQRRSRPWGQGDEWEHWCFSATAFDPLSRERLAAGNGIVGAPNARPRGVRFLDDVLPPRGWEWADKRWVLDLWSREWVEERIITAVEVETEGERWVYDMLDPNASVLAGREEEMMMGGGSKDSGAWGDDAGAWDESSADPVRRDPAKAGGERARQLLLRQQARHSSQPSWEESVGGDAVGRRGEWRRRRWVRLVKRKSVDGGKA